MILTPGITVVQTYNQEGSGVYQDAVDLENVFVRVSANVLSCVRVCISMCVCARACVCMCVRVCVCTCVVTCMCECRYTGGGARGELCVFTRRRQ